MYKIIWINCLGETAYIYPGSLGIWNLIHYVWKTFDTRLKHIFKVNNIFTSAFTITHHLYQVHNLTHTKVTASMCIKHLTNTNTFGVIYSCSRNINNIKSSTIKHTSIPLS